MEACGTSGDEGGAERLPATCSILDGWWDEMYDGENGWAIATADDPDEAMESAGETTDGVDNPVRDKFEAASIYQLLEHEILPLFYAGTGRPTSGWLDRVRHNWITLGPKVTSTRMVADYRDQLYRPAQRRHRAATGTADR